MSMQITDLAWAAGFLDGEASFSLLSKSGNYTNPDRHLIVIEATNTCSLALDKLQQLFGGQVREKIRKTGNIEKWSPAWSWLIYGKQAANVCEQLLPYLVVKRPQATLIIGYQSINDMYKPGQHVTLSDEERELRRQFKARITELNRRGPAA